jgi:hypothetical protein
MGNSKAGIQTNSRHNKGQMGMGDFADRMGGEFTLNNSKQFIMPADYNTPNIADYNSPSLIEDTNELLKADLEAMRTRLMQEIVQHSKVR